MVRGEYRREETLSRAVIIATIDYAASHWQTFFYYGVGLDPVFGFPFTHSL